MVLRLTGGPALGGIVLAVCLATGLCVGPPTAAAEITEIIDATGDGTNPLDCPPGVAVDGSGNVFVAGFGSNNAFKITPGGVITEIIDDFGDGTNPFFGPIDFSVAVSGTDVFVTGCFRDNAFRIAGVADPGRPTPVPVLSLLGLILLCAVMLAAGVGKLRDRRRARPF